MSDKTVLKLKKPVLNTDGNRLTQLELREPTAGDLMRFGLPVTGDGEIKWDKAFQMLEALTTIQLPVLKQLGPKDAVAAIRVISEFFGGADEDDVKN